MSKGYEKEGAKKELIEKAIQNVLNKGMRTADIKNNNEKAVSTKQMGQAVIAELNILSGK